VKLSRWCILVSFCALQAAAQVAHAADASAKQLFVAGQQAYDAGRYDVAIKAFEEAQAVAPSDLLIFDLAQCYRKKFLATGEPAILEKAIELYRKFLATPSRGRERAMASDAIAESLLVQAKRVGDSLAPPSEDKKAPGRTELMLVTEAPQALISLDDQSPSPAPFLATVTPGEHRARGSAPGYFPGDARVTAVEGRFIVSEIRLKPRPVVLGVSGKPTSVFQLDGVTVGTTPIERLEVSPGHHHVVARRRGYQAWERDLELLPGTTLQLDPAPHPTARRRAMRWTGLAAGLFAAAALTSGTVWATQYTSALAYRNQTGMRTERGIEQYQQQLSTIEQARNWTAASLALGGGLLITTLTLYWLD